MESRFLLTFVILILLVFAVITRKILLNRSFVEKILVGVYTTLLSIALLIFWYVTEQNIMSLLTISALLFLFSVSILFTAFAKKKE